MRLSARAHLWILMGLAFAALATVVAVLFALRLMEARERAFSDAQAHAASIAKSMDHFHDSVMAEAHRAGKKPLAAAQLSRPANSAACSAWLSELVAGRPEFFNVVIYNDKAQPVCSAAPLAASAGSASSGKPRPASMEPAAYFKIQHSGRPAVGPIFHPSAKQPAPLSNRVAWPEEPAPSHATDDLTPYAIGAPIHDASGAFKGALLFQVRPQTRSALLLGAADSARAQGASFYLLSAKGSVLAAQEAPSARPAGSSGSSNSLPGVMGLTVLSDGPPRAVSGNRLWLSGDRLWLPGGAFASVAALKSSSWLVLAAVPSESVYGPLRNVILAQTGVITLFGFLAFFATRGISGRIERAAETLARAAAKPELISSLPPTGVLEIDRSLAQIQQAHSSSELALFERSLWQTASQRSLSGLAILRQNDSDGDASVVIANPAFARLCGLAPGQKPSSLLSLPPGSALSDPAARAELQSAIRRNIAASREANGKDWDGALRHLSIVLTPLFECGSGVSDLARLPEPEFSPAESRRGEPVPPRSSGEGSQRGALFSLTLDDLTEISQREAALALHTTTDALTGLPNRALFTDRLSQALEFANLSQAKVAVAFLDIDRFKFINETIGHQAGDWLITQTAERLSSRMRPGDTLCRLGGDEFGVVLANLTGSFDEAGSLMGHLREALVEPFFYRGQEISMSCSIGVALYPEDGQTPATLLQRADIAMFRAKDSGRSGAQFFSQDMRVAVEERLHMEQALNGALRRGEIEIHYQPKFSLSTGAVVGMEALARWSHPKLGRVSPAKFIPLAEESELITLLGREALTAALRDVKVLWDAGFRDIPVAVNISARQIQPGFLEEIEAALAASGLPASSLHAEITESVILPNSGAAASFLAGLTRLGVSVALDDFGTGWSSLSMLKKLPLSYLKMDRSFVDGLGQDPEDEAIAAAIISMAKALGLEVIAEGVETQLQADRLRALGAQQAQGFYMLGAQPIGQLLAWLQAGAPLADLCGESSRLP